MFSDINSMEQKGACVRRGLLAWRYCVECWVTAAMAGLFPGLGGYIPNTTTRLSSNVDVQRDKSDIYIISQAFRKQRNF